MSSNGIVKVTNRGMITIPAELRKKYNLKDGDQVMIVEDEDRLKIIPIRSTKDLQSISVSADELIDVIKKSREDELELEN